MSQKYKLVQDRDGAQASIRRHIGAILWIILVPIVTIAALSFANGFANADKISAGQNEQARFDATWEAGKAIPTMTPTR